MEVLFCPLDDLPNLGDELLLLDDFDFFEKDDAGDDVGFVFEDDNASVVMVGDDMVVLLVVSMDLVESFCCCCCCCLPLKSCRDICCLAPIRSCYKTMTYSNFYSFYH